MYSVHSGTQLLPPEPQTNSCSQRTSRRLQRNRMPDRASTPGRFCRQAIPAIPILFIPFQAAATAAGGPRKSCHGDAFYRAYTAAASASGMQLMRLIYAAQWRCAVSSRDPRVGRQSGMAYLRRRGNPSKHSNHSNSKPWLRGCVYIASVRMVHFKPEWSCAPSCSKFWVKRKTLPAFGWQTMSSPSPAPPRTNVVDPPCDRKTSCS